MQRANHKLQWKIRLKTSVLQTTQNPDFLKDLLKYDISLMSVTSCIAKGTALSHHFQKQETSTIRRQEFTAFNPCGESMRRLGMREINTSRHIVDTSPLSQPLLVATTSHFNEESHRPCLQGGRVTLLPG